MYPENLVQIKKGALELSPDDFFSEFNRRVLCESLARCDETGKFDFTLLNEVFDADEMGRITSMVVRRRQLKENGAQLLSNMLTRLREESFRRKMSGDDMAQIADILAHKRGRTKKE